MNRNIRYMSSLSESTSEEDDKFVGLNAFVRARQNINTTTGSRSGSRSGSSSNDVYEDEPDNNESTSSRGTNILNGIGQNDGEIPEEFQPSSEPPNIRPLENQPSNRKPNTFNRTMFAIASTGALASAAVAIRQLYLERKTIKLMGKLNKLTYKCNALTGEVRNECLDKLKTRFEYDINDIYDECESVEDPDECKRKVSSALNNNQSRDL